MPRNPLMRYDLTRTKPQMSGTELQMRRLSPLLVHRYLSFGMLKALSAPDISDDTFRRFVEQAKCKPNELVSQPDEQRFRLDGLKVELIYGTSNRGIERFLATGTISPDDVQLWRKLKKGLYTNIFWHDAAVGSISGSAELGCRELGLKFHSIFDMYRGRPIPEKPYEVSMSGTTVRPDLIFAVSEGNQSTSYYVEFDRGTETKATLNHKYRRYRKLWRHMIDAKLPRPVLLFVFTEYERMLNTMDDFAEIADKDEGKDKGKTGPVRFRYMPELNLRYAPEMFHDGRIMTGKWERIGNDPVLLYEKAANSVAA